MIGIAAGGNEDLGREKPPKLEIYRCGRGMGVNGPSLLTEFHNGKRVSGDPRCEEITTNIRPFAAKCGQRAGGPIDWGSGAGLMDRQRIAKLQSSAHFRSFPIMRVVLDWDSDALSGIPAHDCPSLRAYCVEMAGLSSTLQRREGRSLLSGTVLSYNNDRCLLHKMASGKCQQISIEVGRTKGGRVSVLSGGHRETRCTGWVSSKGGYIG